MSKVVIVNYKFNDAFKIPKNIDLEDETVVKGWWVKWNTLHILFVDGTEKKIESEGWTNDLDWKEPNEDPVIENAEDWNLEDDDDEDEEIDEKRLQEHKDALQLAEWRKKLPSKAVCDYLDKNLPGWREEPKDEI